MSYDRKKRLFAKLVIDQFKTVPNKPKANDFAYAQEHRKLREFSEQLFLASGKKENLSPSDVLLAMHLSADRSDVAPMLSYVAHLAIGSMLGVKSTTFKGKFVCSCCSGIYERKGDSYQCDTCGYLGKVDQYGFPVSLPAKQPVRMKRRQFHQLIKEIKSFGLSMKDTYTLVSFEAKVPLPLVHAGLCTTSTEINRLISGCQTVLNNIPKGSIKG
ncbi:hypothetical protein [Vibrio sp. THAF190c]|uniref:hypothetical protein n=1 Tax=Vibrio sp. THAF190c TaxID=2587865 RepID=UPI001268CE3C|nr:hypothetical protein [Vibrio sp. THAF190c]QFT13385.1 hypothetical protein FIV04_25880 [Vibrio sp. THAF190c]